MAHEEINEGLKKVGKRIHINKEEFTYLIHQAKLPSTKNQFTYSDFVQMSLAEMRNYANRKVETAFAAVTAALM